MKPSKSQEEGDKRFPKEIPKSEVPSAKKSASLEEKFLKNQHDIISF